MRKVVAVLLAAVATLAAAREPREAKLKKPRIAILSFPAASGAVGCGWGNSEGRMANVLRDLFTTQIMEDGEGVVRVIERERLNEIRGELKFEQSGEVDAATAQKIGKLLGVRYMLTGKMTRFACKKTGAATGWGVGALVGKATGSSLAGKVAGSANTHKVKFTGRLDVRLIDTQSGEILGTFKDEEETADTSVKIAGGGTDVEYDSELANKVFEPIAQRMGPKIVKKIASVHEENLAADAEEDAEEPAPRKKKGGEEGEDAPRGGKKVAAATGGDDADGAGGSGRKAGKGPSMQVFGNEFDFVPGDKVLFFDDFSDTDLGDSPIRFKGSGLAVVDSDGKRWVKETKDGSCSGSGQKLRLDVKKDFPQKFTVEFDAVLGAAGVYKVFVGRSQLIQLWWEGVELGNDAVRTEIPAGVQHVAVSVNDTYVKAYVGGKRVHQHTDGIKRPFDEVRVCFYTSRQVNLKKVTERTALLTNFKIAEGGKDYGSELTRLGRIVTHGITFDSGSDRIRPESGPTLRKVLKLLQDDAGLAFEIQGHTDDQGGDPVNRPLSERRAAAVKAWLVGEGIEDGRLTTKGLGASKPLEANDTAEGRANNRRVEFVKKA